MATASKIRVACKLPSGLTVDHKGQTVTFKGAGDPYAVGGFGVTSDVDADWFKSWTTEAKDFPPVANGTLYAMADNDDGSSAKERKGVKTGVEPLDPYAPAPGVEPTDDMKAKLATMPPPAAA